MRRIPFLGAHRHGDDRKYHQQQVHTLGLLGAGQPKAIGQALAHNGTLVVTGLSVVRGGTVPVRATP
jgi:hypothetical protein